uniref:hypothetical protein n=1 Tax=Flavobacterium sp. TaxID=239 RepID=UPI004049A528
MRKKSIKIESKQLKIQFSENNKECLRDVKVISLLQIQNDELNSKILNRKRPFFEQLLYKE